MLIVSGTTSPVVKVVNEFWADKKQRCWISRHVVDGEFVVESNPGVTGLNYQRMKNNMFPDMTYDEIEEKVLSIKNPKCVASFSTWSFDLQMPLMKAGFLTDSPFHQDLDRIELMFAVLFDIAASIKYNVDAMMNISPIDKDYLLGCGGGFQGRVVSQMVADLTDKKVVIKEGYRQASILGGVNICNSAIGYPLKTLA